MQGQHLPRPAAPEARPVGWLTYGKTRFRRRDGSARSPGACFPVSVRLRRKQSLRWSVFRREPSKDLE